jgi:hypothetical protein
MEGAGFLILVHQKNTCGHLVRLPIHPQPIFTFRRASKVKLRSSFEFCGVHSEKKDTAQIGIFPDTIPLCAMVVP